MNAELDRSKRRGHLCTLLAASSALAAIILGTLVASSACLADIIILKCDFRGFGGRPIYFTRYSDGSPSRIGISPGIGDRALFFSDRSGAQIFVEINIDGSPITFTTIQPNMRAIHARQVLTLDGTVLSPRRKPDAARVQMRTDKIPFKGRDWCPWPLNPQA
jgi:hypothetical protein